MKRLFSTLAFGLFFAGSALAQPPGVVLNPGETYVPGSLRDQFGNPISQQRILFRPEIRRPDFINPAIFDTGFEHQGVTVDPNTGALLHHVQRERMLDSATDPNRHIVDPGSLRYVNSYERDSQGVLWLVTGKTWTSYGNPHSSVNRVRYNSSGGTMSRVDDRVETRIVDSVEAVPQVDPSGRVVSPVRNSRPAHSAHSSSGLMGLFE